MVCFREQLMVLRATLAQQRIWQKFCWRRQFIGHSNWVLNITKELQLSQEREVDGLKCPMQGGKHKYASARGVVEQ